MTSRLTASFAKQFGQDLVVHGNFEMPLECFRVTVLFGPSGCGKTTVLRCLAGLERPSQGRIQGGDRIWFDADSRVSLPPQQRDIGFCFQEPSLFPHLSIADNVGFGHRGPRRQNRRDVLEMLERFRILDTADRFPHQVSGGQAQRAALARSLMTRPRLLLLDEPLAALDSVLREELRRELRTQLSAFAVPTILVTHDRLEALALADQVVVMDQGHVLQCGSIQHVFMHPSSSQVARIVGVETIQQGMIVAIVDGLAKVQVGTTTLMALSPTEPATQVYACIRGEDVTLSRQSISASSSRNRLSCHIASIEPEGALLRVTLEAGFPLTAVITRPAALEMDLKPGDQVTASIKATAVHLIARH